MGRRETSSVSKNFFFQESPAPVASPAKFTCNHTPVDSQRPKSVPDMTFSYADPFTVRRKGRTRSIQGTIFPDVTLLVTEPFVEARRRLRPLANVTMTDTEAAAKKW